MKQCWDCNGTGWVSDGQPEDGMLTGRMTCPTCQGRRVVTDAQILEAIKRLAELPELPAGRPS